MKPSMIIGKELLDRSIRQVDELYPLLESIFVGMKYDDVVFERALKCLNTAIELCSIKSKLYVPKVVSDMRKFINDGTSQAAKYFYTAIAYRWRRLVAICYAIERNEVLKFGNTKATASKVDIARKMNLKLSTTIAGIKRNVDETVMMFSLGAHGDTMGKLLKRLGIKAERKVCDTKETEE